MRSSAEAFPETNTHRDLMEKDRGRRPLFELEQQVQAAKIKVVGSAEAVQCGEPDDAAQFTGVEFIVANTVCRPPCLTGAGQDPAGTKLTGAWRRLESGGRRGRGSGGPRIRSRGY